MIYTNHNFPCLVKGGENIEDAFAPQITLDEKYHRIARNTLRHLTYGVSFKQSKLLTWDNFSALFIHRNGALLAAIRHELQNLFFNAYECLHNQQMDAEAEDRAGILITHLLTMYPFLDGKDGDRLFIPQKINQKWDLIEYINERIDISPQKGFLAKFLKDEDRLYAYGLVPKSTTYAQPYLCIMGSAYPSAQGAKFNWLYNFAWNKSVGEAHDTSKLEQWIQKHHSIITLGHSKGGTVAMILAAKFADQIAKAECLCPTALTTATLNNLITKWNDIPDEKKPHINIYTQAGDPIFYLDNIFLPNTTFFYIRVPNVFVNHLMAHIHYLVGRQSVEISKMDYTAECFTSGWRNYLSMNKQALNVVIFPILYTTCLLSFCIRDVKDFCKRQLNTLMEDGFQSGLLVYAAATCLGLSLPLPFCLLTGTTIIQRLSSGFNKGEKLTSSLALMGLLALAVTATVSIVGIVYSLTRPFSGFLPKGPTKGNHTPAKTTKSLYAPPQPETSKENNSRTASNDAINKNAIDSCDDVRENVNQTTKLLINTFGKNTVMINTGDTTYDQDQQQRATTPQIANNRTIDNNRFTPPCDRVMKL